MERAVEIGNWKIIKNNVGGITFMGPKGEALYLAPFASKRERKAVIDALPKYVKEFYINKYQSEEKS